MAEQGENIFCSMFDVLTEAGPRLMVGAMGVNDARTCGDGGIGSERERERYEPPAGGRCSSAGSLWRGSGTCFGSVGETAESETILLFLCGGSWEVSEGPRFKVTKPASKPLSFDNARPRWLAGLPHAQRAMRALGEVRVLVSPGLRPKRSVSMEAPPGNAEVGVCDPGVLVWEPTAGLTAVGTVRGTSAGILTGMEPGNASGECVA